MKKLLIAGTVMSAAAAGMAVTEAELLARIDANGDQMVTKEEYIEYYCNDITSRDANKDGVLTPSEFPYRAFKAADTDENGELTAEELKALYSKHFNRRDKNKDGVITLDEFLASSNSVG